MKKLMPLLFFLLLIFIFICTSCGESRSASPTPTPAPGSNQTRESNEPAGNPAVPSLVGGQGKLPEPTPEETVKRSTTYEPSIFVIEASGSWERTVEEGIKVNYECELYLDKIEPYNMHDDNGAYTGMFWMKMKVDTSEMLSKINVPMFSIGIGAEGEGIEDNVSIYLRDGYTRDPTASFDIPDGEGGTLKPDFDALAGRGSFVISQTSGNVFYFFIDEQKGISDAQQKSGSSPVEVNYVVHVAPDPTREATQRAAKIFISLPDGSSTVLDGVWRRLPGYPDDLSKYYNSGESRKILDNHQIGN